MKKTAFIFSLFIFLLQMSPAYPLELNVKGSRMSIKAENEPLSSILHAFAEQGIKISADPNLTPDISASFKDKKIENALKIIFRNLNYILIWKNISTPLGDFAKLEEIRLYTPGRKHYIKTIAPETGRLAKNPDDGSIYIKNQILIRLTKAVNLKDFRKFLLDNGLGVLGYSRMTGIIKILLPEGSDYFAILDLIKNYPGLEKAEPNYAYPVNRPYYAPGSPVKTADAKTGVLSSNPVPVAVIDSGLSADYLSEPYVYASYNSIDPESAISDSLGHGTQMVMVAGGAVTPMGVSTGTVTPVIAIKGFGDDGYISNYDLMDGIEFALDNGARVMSLSWGSETESAFLEQAFDYAASKGMIILAAAGNEPTGSSMYPASYDSVIGVGALDPEGKTWDKSNYGDSVNVYAPGFASLPVGYKGDAGTYAGTSISTAYAANLVAGYLSKNPDASIKEILTSLAESSGSSE